jgi:hypothetical protein
VEEERVDVWVSCGGGAKEDCFCEWGVDGDDHVWRGGGDAISQRSQAEVGALLLDAGVDVSC